jgi:hypothetical protein
MRNRKGEKCIVFECDCSICEGKRYERHIDRYGETLTLTDGSDIFMPGKAQLIKAWSVLNRIAPETANAIIEETYVQYEKQVFQRKDRGR